jgi:hypothetical protein
MNPVDYRALLVKYMAIVADDLGASPVPRGLGGSKPESLTDAEWAEMKRLAREAGLEDSPQ